MSSHRVVHTGDSIFHSVFTLSYKPHVSSSAQVVRIYCLKVVQEEGGGVSLSF